MDELNGRLKMSEKLKINRNFSVWRERKGKTKGKQRHEGLWDGIWHIGVPEGEMEEWGKKIEKIMAENIWNLMNGTNLQIREAQWSPSRINLKQTTPRHILNYACLQKKDKEKNLEKIEKRSHCLQENNSVNHLSVLSETTEARRQ